jgi:putative selenate reductase FAD-binding subunit
MITDILRPRTVREAVRAKSGPDSAYLGGGTWLNARRSDVPTVLISLEKLSLGTIDMAGDGCTLGATVTLQQVVDALRVPRALRDAASLTASRTLRNMKTVGGEIGRWPEDSTLIPALLALDAGVLLAGRKKPVPPDHARGGDSLVLGIVVPRISRFSAVRAASRTSHSGAFLVAAVSAASTHPAISDARVVLSDCRGQLLRLVAVEETLNGSPLPPREQVEGMVSRAFSPAGSLHASAGYKRYMAGILVADALRDLSAEAVT